MATIDEKPTGIHNVDHNDDVQTIDHVVHIAHETQGKTSPWTWNMFRLYLVLAVAYLCGYVITLCSLEMFLIFSSKSGIADILLVASMAMMGRSWAV